MRKVIVSMNITLDGFMAASDQGMEWHVRYWNEEMAEELSFQLSLADTIMLGRKTYQAMAAYWPLQITNPYCPRTDIAFAEMMHRYRKTVFSKTLRQVFWHNSLLLPGDIADETGKLKGMPGKDLVTYGSCSLVHTLISSRLVDEYRVWVHPVVLGSGAPFELDRKLVSMTGEKEFSSGVVLRSYRSLHVLSPDMRRT